MRNVYIMRKKDAYANVVLCIINWMECKVRLPTLWFYRHLNTAIWTVEN